MENPRPEKVAVVAEVSEKLAAAQAVVLTEYRGMSVSQLASLRRALRSSGAEYKVYKNTLVRRAADEAGMSALNEQLVGPTGVVFVSTACSLKSMVPMSYTLVETHGPISNWMITPVVVA